MQAGDQALAQSYPVDSGVFDEAFEADGSVRPIYGDLFSRIDGSRLVELKGEIQVALAERKVEFGPPNSRAPFSVDAIPRLISGEDWSELERGLIQRVRALNAFLADAYGEQRVIEATCRIPGLG